MNILVYRSVRPEEMGFVINDIIKKFNDIKKISVITRPANAYTMKMLPRVDSVLTYSSYIFKYESKYIEEIEVLKKNKFDLAIVPTTGNISSYDNIRVFNNKVFGKMNIFFYKYPSVFMKYKYKFIKNFMSNLLYIPLFLISIILSIIFIFIVYIKFSLQKLGIK